MGGKSLCGPNEIVQSVTSFSSSESTEHSNSTHDAHKTSVGGTQSLLEQRLSDVSNILSIYLKYKLLMY